jgi:Domain of unknown function (DUF4252)
MKKIFSIAFIFFFQINFAQTAFDKFEGKEGVSVMTLNKKMIDLVSKVKMDTANKDNQLYVSFIKKLDYLKVITTRNTGLEADLKVTAEKYAKNSSLDALPTTTELGKNINFFVKNGTVENKTKELLVLVQDIKTSEIILLSLSGDINLEELSALTNKMKIHIGNVFKRQ